MYPPVTLYSPSPLIPKCGINIKKMHKDLFILVEATSNTKPICIVTSLLKRNIAGGKISKFLVY
jgi:hypothetical protein